MASFGTIYTYPANPRAMKVMAAAALNGLKVDEFPTFEMFKTNRTPEFLEKFPLGKVPAFESADGVCIFESDAIVQFVAESGPARNQLLGATAAERASVRQWTEYANNEIFAVVQDLVLWRFGMASFNKSLEEKSLKTLESSLQLLENQFEKRQYIALSQPSLADISIVAALVWAFSQVIDIEMRAKYPTLMEWHTRVLSQKEIGKAFGSPGFIDVRKASL